MTWAFNSTANCNVGSLGPSLTEFCSNSTFLVFMTLLNSLFRDNDKISGKCQRVKPVERTDEEYDFVVVGGGAAGSVVAARLIENPEWKVLLLEAGPDEPAGAQVPAFSTRFLETGNIWNYKTSNESNSCSATNGSCPWPSGKNLGGNTAHNGMIYLRGHPEDYDEWAALGNEGWGWNDVKGYFLKAEDNGEIERVGRKHHATGGRLSVERFRYIPTLGSSIFEASLEAGYGVSEDLNGDRKTGFSRIQGMQKNGIRHSSSRAYLWPMRDSGNLHVSLNSTVTKLIIVNNTAVGVEYHKDGQRKSVRVTREVVVSGGVVESPHLLLLSGIGPKEHLESVGIEVVKDLPGVGENLHDHPCAIIPMTINETDTYDNYLDAAEEYQQFQTGPLSAIGMVQVVGMLASNMTTPNRPDVEVYVFSHLSNCASGEVGALQSSGRRSVTLLPSYLYPKSRGRITLKSRNPFDGPTIWANYFGNPEDLRRVVVAIKMTVALFETEALRAHDFTLSDAPLEACADHEFRSDDYWACVAKQANYALYHQGGTCKMGPSSDPMAVVDSRLRVYGIAGLRVADASIMPVVPASNTAAPAMMIGERVADFIKEDFAPDPVQGTRPHRFGTKSRGHHARGHGHARARN